MCGRRRVGAPILDSEATRRERTLKNRPPLPQHLMSRHRYHALLVRLQIELVKLQRCVIERGQRILVIVEGRDAAGKDGTIKSIVEHLSPRDTRVVALGPPSNREQCSW
jgi:polyphosphate kinase